MRPTSLVVIGADDSVVLLSNTANNIPGVNS